MADKPNVYEVRTATTALEVRGLDSDAPVIEGYAATYNEPYDMGPFREVILPGAFTRTLSAGPDVRLLIDHEGQPLARTKSGTLELDGSDPKGLRIRATLDQSDPDVQRLLPKMRRGDLDQMSFAFRVPAGGDSWSEDYTLREMRELNLSGGDVSVVTYPANPGTVASVRSRDLLEARCVFIEAMVREIRVGKTLSAANMVKLQSILDLLAQADVAADLADCALDDAQAALADVLGVPNPDPPDPDDVTPVRSAHPLSLAQAVARRLSIAGH